MVQIYILLLCFVSYNQDPKPFKGLEGYISLETNEDMMTDGDTPRCKQEMEIGWKLKNEGRR